MKKTETERTYVFRFKYRPKTMHHVVTAPVAVMDYMESQWRQAGLKFTKIEK